MSGTYFMLNGHVYKAEENLGLFYDCEVSFVRQPAKKQKRMRLELEAPPILRAQRAEWEESPDEI